MNPASSLQIYTPQTLRRVQHAALNTTGNPPRGDFRVPGLPLLVDHTTLRAAHTLLNPVAQISDLLSSIYLLTGLILMKRRLKSYSEVYTLN